MENKDGVISNLASIAPADMLNVWNATKLSSKSGTVNTADGEWSLFYTFTWFRTQNSAQKLLSLTVASKMSFDSHKNKVINIQLFFLYEIFHALDDDDDDVMVIRKKIEVPILRPIIRLWNQSACTYSTTSSRYTCAMSVLFENIYAK